MDEQKIYRENFKGAFNSSEYNIKYMEKFNSPKNICSYLKKLEIKDVKIYSTLTTLGYCILTLSICGNLNVGTIMRTSQLLGADKYIIFGKRSFDRRSAVGAMNYMNVERVFGLKDNSCDVKKDLTNNERMICPDKFYKYMIENKLVPVFLEQKQKAIYNDNINWNSYERKLKKEHKFCFIFGNEGDGIAEDIIDKGLTIPGSFIICVRQLGALRSFNVSSTVAIIISQYKNYKIKKRLDCYNLSL